MLCVKPVVPVILKNSVRRDIGPKVSPTTALWKDINNIISKTKFFFDLINHWWYNKRFCEVIAKWAVYIACVLQVFC